MNPPPLILAHGWALNRAIWQPLIDLLADHFHCHPLDLPGHGKRAAETCPTTIEALAAQILDTAPKHPAHWLGHSLGGMAALQAAQQAPQRFISLRLLCTTPRFTQTTDWPHGTALDRFAQFAAELQRNYRGGLRKFLLLQAGPTREARRLTQQTLKLLAQHPAPSPATLAAGLTILRTADLRPALPKLHLPTQIIIAQRDRITHPAAGHALHRLLPAAQLATLNSGHAPMLSHPQDLARQLRQFTPTPP
ncbi:MAG: alpha/beta fold hydrolase [Cellvibrionales bacterium]|nr:alpha/beta fold hydrolase [Cellvibrionales bacterium]